MEPSTDIRRYGGGAPDVPVGGRSRRRRQASGMARRAAVGALSLATAALLAGCTTHAPTVRVDGATIRSRTADAILVDVELSLSNENTAEVVLREFEYTVSGGATFNGRRRADLTLAPLTTQSMTIPAVLAGDGEAPDPASLRVDGQVGWRGSADLEKALFDAGLYRPRAPFSGSVASEASPAQTTPTNEADRRPR